MSRSSAAYFKTVQPCFVCVRSLYILGGCRDEVRYYPAGEDRDLTFGLRHFVHTTAVVSFNRRLLSYSSVSACI